MSMKKPILKRGWLNNQQELYITSPFGSRGLKDHRFHYGVDIRAKVGTPIYSPISGKLTCHGVSRSAGLYCSVTSGNLCLVFMHLSSCVLGEGANRSKSVSEGELIGKSGGAPGNRLSGVYSRGAHLHFEYRWLSNGAKIPGTSAAAINPVFYLGERLVGVVKKNVVSNGVKLEIDKKTGEEETYNVGDGNPLKYSEISQAEVTAAQNENGVCETSDNETEVFTDDDEDKNVNERYAPGIWQIIKIAMDAEVQDYILIDATVSTMTGSILGFFNKACQRPLVEFFGDTYGDQYYFIIRRPPFDEKLMTKALVNQYLMIDDSLNELIKKREATKITEPNWDESGNVYQEATKLNEWRKKYGYGTAYYNKMAELEQEIRSRQENIQTYSSNYIISDNEIISSSISYNTQGIYSWYQYYPQFDMSGDEMQYLVPAVMFPEYAAIWGSRSLQIQSQYRNFRGTGIRDSLEKGDNNRNADEIYSNVLDDMRYLVESNAYAPFTRQGTITISGTRRIKRGMFIQVQLEKGIDEIFYVDSVQQSYAINGKSISRTTTLNVSRGMVKKYIPSNRNFRTDEKEKSESGEYSYFNLIDFGKFDKKNVTVNTWRDAISKWKVNRKVFMFFLQRMQFINSLDDVYKN